MDRIVNDLLGGSVDLDNLIQNSYKNFHAKGLDYICLKRAADHTIKVYFLDGDASKLPEVVNPHDHRYLFSSRVLAGRLEDYTYIPTTNEGAETFQTFDYMTPLNGGNGFTYRGEERLLRTKINRITEGQCLFTSSKNIHTIAAKADQTVIMLEQYADVVPLNKPTTLWVPEGEPKPDVSGLYEKHTPDEFLNRIQTIKTLLALG